MKIHQVNKLLFGKLCFYIIRKDCKKIGKGLDINNICLPLRVCKLYICHGGVPMSVRLG
jgi:hypothetical protein